MYFSASVCFLLFLREENDFSQLCLKIFQKPKILLSGEFTCFGRKPLLGVSIGSPLTTYVIVGKDMQYNEW